MTRLCACGRRIWGTGTRCRRCRSLARTRRLLRLLASFWDRLALETTDPQKRQVWQDYARNNRELAGMLERAA